MLAEGLFNRGWIVALVVGLIAGWLASLMVGRTRTGLLANLIVGVIGSFIGTYTFALLGIQFAGLLGAFITATAGAVILLLLLRLVRRVA